MFRRCLVAFALVAGSVLAQAQQQPTFRSETNYVEVDAVVTDAGGHFVSGLTAADFEVSEQRRPQSISTFTYIDMPIGRTAVSSTPAPVLFRPDLAAQERVSADRIYLIYLNTDSTLLARIRAKEFVRDYLQPNDIAAVWNAESVKRQVTFTSDKKTLVDAIGPSRENAGAAPTPQDRAVAQGDKLRDAINWLDGIQGRRKSLILFTEGWAVIPGNERDASGRPNENERSPTGWRAGGWAHSSSAAPG